MVSVRDLVSLRDSGEISQEEMMRRLANLVYATGTFEAGKPYAPGSVEDMTQLVVAGDLTPAELNRIMASVAVFERQHDTRPLQLID